MTQQNGKNCPGCGVPLTDPSWDVDFMSADRAYFEKYPDASSYVRPVFPTEHPFSCCSVQLIRVSQLESGVRYRQEVAEATA